MEEPIKPDGSHVDMFDGCMKVVEAWTKAPDPPARPRSRTA
jgi:hypothetical protein